MNALDQSELSEGMSALEAHYGRRFHPRHAVVWWKHLSDLTTAEWWQAIDHLLSQEPDRDRLLPIPRDIRALAGVDRHYHQAALPSAPSAEDFQRTANMIAKFRQQQGWT
jgi:hypothetical protein